jgi:Protein of unknown function (DUF3099)
MPVRDRLYFALMGLCAGMFVLAWAVVRLYSVTTAVVMSAVALAIPPPIAVIIANAEDEASRRR